MPFGLFDQTEMDTTTSLQGTQFYSDYNRMQRNYAFVNIPHIPSQNLPPDGMPSTPFGMANQFFVNSNRYAHV
jgi:hypothetical protein